MAESPRRVGSLVIDSQPDRAGAPIVVWYSSPPRGIPICDVLVVMPGRQRNAMEYRDNWRKHTDARGALLLVPEMTRAAFPGARSYNQGGIATRRGRIRSRRRWALTEIDNIVTQAADQLGYVDPAHFSIYGHSAGGQFVHRLVLLCPPARLRRAVAANPGWYTLPDPDLDYPYGLGGIDLASDDLAVSFGKRLTLLVGGDDDDPEGDGVQHNEVIDRYGLHRRERAEQFIAIARQRAEAAATAFHWDVSIVPGVAHSDELISPAAAELLLPPRSGQPFDGNVIDAEPSTIAPN